MDYEEGSESLLEAHFKQEKADDDPLFLAESSSRTRASREPEVGLQQHEGTRQISLQDVVNASDPLAEDQQQTHSIERVPDVETSGTNRSSRSRGVGQSPRKVLSMKFDDSYLKSFDGVLKLIQIIMTLTSLICVVSSGNGKGGYLNLALSWHLRVFVFSLVSSFLVSVVMVFVYASSLIQAFTSLNWSLLEMIIYSVLTFFLLIGSSFVASMVDYYQKPQADVAQWTVNQLLSAVVLGYGSMLLYAATAGLGYRKWRRDGSRYNGRYQLQNTQSDSLEALA